MGMSSSLLRLRAWIGLIAFSGTFGLGLLSPGHLGADDDAACGQTGFLNGHPRLQFETVKPTPGATHCPICHWQRAVSMARVASAEAWIFILNPVDAIQSRLSRTVASAIVDPRLSRGPPCDQQT
jgi:hypothetical protein